MSKFHSTLSRRDFMKGLGLAGAGLGAAAATVPVLHDLGEIATSPKSNYNRPWWVKEREFKNPTVGVDWSIIKPWQEGYETGGIPYQGYFNEASGARPEDEVFRKALIEKQLASMEARLARGDPGYATKDWALRYGAAGSLSRSRPFYGDPVKGSSWCPAPIDKWTGTPEEATNMLRAATHYFGAYNIGIMEIDSDTTKLFKPRSTRFEDVDEPYQDGSQKVIPQKCKWVIAYAVAQSTEITKSAGISYYRGGSPAGYAQGPMVKYRLERFLKYLGYQSCYVGDILNVALGVMTGVGELNRICIQTTPEFGTMLRYSPGIATDLPLVPTKPIDAGMFHFCKTCLLCAQTCDEANGKTPLSMEKEPTYEITGPYNRLGVEAFQMRRGRCNFCPYCTGSCPFAIHNISPIHNVIKATIATTSFFNGFFADMEEVFGYGMHDEPHYYEEWWDRDLNTWEYDVNLCGEG